MRACTQAMTLPKYTSTVLSRALKTEMGAYTELASRYTGKTTSPELPALVAKHQAEFQTVRCIRAKGLGFRERS